MYISDLDFDLNRRGQIFLNSHNLVIFEARSLKFCMEVDLDNAKIYQTSILTSTAEVNFF